MSIILFQEHCNECKQTVHCGDSVGIRATVCILYPICIITNSTCTH